jgi:hypothetical protein
VYYLETRLDALGLSIRRAVVGLALGVVGAIGAAAGLVMAVVLLLRGLAEALTVLFGGRAWAGDLVVGGGVILLTAGSLWAVKAYLASVARRRTVEKYEHQRSQQRTRVGHDASQRVAGR